MIEEYRARLEAVFAEQKLGVLSTHQDGQPYCSLVAFAAGDDLRQLVFATSRATRKFANLSADKRVAMLVDNRDNDESDFQKATAITVIGRAGEVDKDIENKLLRKYLDKHASLRGFVFSDDCALVRIEVEQYIYVDQFQKIIRITPNGVENSGQGHA